MANGTPRRSVSFGAPLPPSGKPVDIIPRFAPWKPQVKHHCESVAARRREIDFLQTKTQTILDRASKILNKRETPRDMSRESYGRRVAWERSSFGSTIGARKMDQLIAIRPPRDCFTATQANNLLNLVVSAAEGHVERHTPPDPRKPQTKKDEAIPPPALLPPFNLRVKQRPLPKSYYLAGSLRERRETVRLKEKEKHKRRPVRERLFVVGHGVRYDGSKPAEIPEGMGYQNARKNVEQKLEEYHRNYQAKRELSHRVSVFLKEKRKSRESIMVEKERRHSEIKEAIEGARRASKITIELARRSSQMTSEGARRASQMTVLKRKSINLIGEKNK
ncbi:hypothetical protein R1flu_005750 [Riccia fluitans]|uniref:Uncharacterized protein n=1 Tax=Riccia fluitans TaxID=41844 RepID=A0ABD1YU22_9MARC